MRITFCCATLLFCSHLVFAQSISNVVGIQQGNSAIITYDLNGNTTSSYFVKVYYSIDGGQTFSGELSQVSGDVKSGVRSGNGKKITWYADKEVNFLSGPVIFKVEAESRKALPKPISYDWGSVELTSIKRVADEVHVTFSFTHTSTSYERSSRYLRKRSGLISSGGTEFNAISGVFGGKTVTGYGGDDVDCIRGIPVKGSLVFAPETIDLVIPALKINISDTDFIFKNIPIE